MLLFDLKKLKGEMKMTKKTLSFIMALLLLLSGLYGESVYALDESELSSDFIIYNTDSVSKVELLNAEVVCVDFNDIDNISEEARTIVDRGKLLYIAYPRISAEDLAEVLNIPKTNKTLYQPAQLIGYSIYKHADKYIFANHYNMFMDVAQTSEINTEKHSKMFKDVIEDKSEAPLVDSYIESNFNDVQLADENILYNAEDMQKVIQNAIQERIDFEEQTLNIEQTSQNSSDVMPFSTSFPSKIADETWHDTLYVYDNNNNYYGYLNCIVYGYIIGNGKVNGSRHKVYDVLTSVKAFPKNTGVYVKKYSVEIKANYTDFKTLETSTLPSEISYSDGVSLSSTAGLSDITFGSSLSTSWTYNPESQIITESSSYPRLVKWTAETVSPTGGKAYDISPGMRVASPERYKRAAFAEIRCDSLFLWVTLKTNQINIGGWF